MNGRGGEGGELKERGKGAKEARTHKGSKGTPAKPALMVEAPLSIMRTGPECGAIENSSLALSGGAGR